MKLKRIVISASLAIFLMAGISSMAGVSAATAKPKPPKTDWVARIGWFYTDGVFPQSKVGQPAFSWPACVKAGGDALYVAPGQHIYSGDLNGQYNPKKPAVALVSGPLLNPKDKFRADFYVGNRAKVGKRFLKVSCMKAKKSNPHKLVLAFKSKMNTDFIRKDNTFYSSSNIISNYEFTLFTGQTSTVVDINRSCEEPGTTSITLVSDALAPNTSGIRTVTLPRDDADGTFKGSVTPAADKGSGKYPAVISCGTGRVGIGTINILG